MAIDPRHRRFDQTNILSQLWAVVRPGPRSRATYLIGVAQVAGRVAGAGAAAVPD